MVAEKVVVQLVLDTSRYKSGAAGAARDTAKIRTAADKTSKSVGGLGATALKAGAALGAAFAAKAALDFAKSSIAAFSNLEESINAVNVTYGEGSAAIAALGKGSAESFGLSTRAVNEAAVAMAAFADKIDAADPPGAFENVLQRASDFGSVMNIEVGESLRLFQSGLAGESEPLRKFGIDVSAATVKQVALNEGIFDGVGVMSEAEKVQGRYAAIMAQTAKTAGDFANTSEGLANRQKILGAQWEEMQATIGKELEPAMIKLLSVATKLIPVVGKLGVAVANSLERFEPLIDLLVLFADQFDETTDDVEEAGERFSLIPSQITDQFDKFFDFVSQSLPQQGAAIVDFFTGSEDAAEGASGAFDDFGLSEEILRIRTIALKESIEGGNAALVRMEAPLGRVSTAAGTAAERFQAQADAIRNVATAIAESVNPTLRLLGAQERSVAAERTLVTSRQSVVDAEKDLAKARGKDRVVAEEALAAALRDAQAAVLDATGAQVALEQATANAAGTIVDSRDAFIELTVAAGGTREEAEALLDTLGLFPTVQTVDIFATFHGFERLEQIERLMGGRGSSRFGGDIAVRRHGGPVTAGEPFVVGEAGPELFIPDRAGRIIPNQTTGGQSIIVNVNDTTTTDLAADLAAGLIAAQITQQVEMLGV